MKGNWNLPSHNTVYIRLPFYPWLFSVQLVLFYMRTLYLNTVVCEGNYMESMLRLVREVLYLFIVL